MSEQRADDRPFEVSLADLERIVQALEEGQLGLDDALAHYERGIGLVKVCQARLTDAEQRILLLTSIDGEGEPVLEAFKHEATGRKALGKG